MPQIQKNAKSIAQMSFFLLIEKTENGNTYVLGLTFCVITFEPFKFQICSAPQNDSVFLKQTLVGKKRLKMVGKRTFVSD